MTKLETQLGWLDYTNVEGDYGYPFYIDKRIICDTSTEANMYLVNNMNTLNNNGNRYTEGRIEVINVPDPTPIVTPDLSAG
jgi:hypothetical protein